MSEKEKHDRNYRQRLYERYAEHFQDADGVFDKAAADAWGKAYRAYFKGWLPEEKAAAIADLACGGGRLLHFFESLGYQTLQGVDASADQVAIARQTLPGVQMDDMLRFLERHAGAFDLITGLDVIEHLHKEEVLRFLDASHAALKPGGRVILQTPNAESPWGGSLRYGDFTHETAFTPDLLSRLMKLAGFESITAREVGPVAFGYSMASSLRYLAWRMIHSGLTLWNLAETGGGGSGIFTRVFLISGRKL